VIDGRTRVAHGASDGVSPLQEELDDPRPDVPTGAGHANRLPEPGRRLPAVDDAHGGRAVTGFL
jgi:hypothetical protein